MVERKLNRACYPAPHACTFKDERGGERGERPAGRKPDEVFPKGSFLSPKGPFIIHGTTQTLNNDRQNYLSGRNMCVIIPAA